MWAALPLQSLKPWPPNAISATKPPWRRHSAAVDSFGNREEMGGLGQAVITALKTDEPQNLNVVKLKANRKSPVEAQQQERQLTGADVVMALQRATTQKAKKKKGKRVSVSQNNVERNNESTRDLSNVRDLCIKPEWSDRLEELEGRLQQLGNI